MEFEPGSINQKWIMLIITPFLRPAQFQSDLPKCQFKSDYLSHSAHRTTNFMNPEFQFPQFKVLQSVFFLFNTLPAEMFGGSDFFVCKGLY